MRVYKIKVDKISCSNCGKTITNALTKLSTETQVAVSVVNKMVFVETDVDYELITAKLSEIGYPAVDPNDKKVKFNYDLYIAITLSAFLILSMVVHIYEIEALMIFTNNWLVLIAASILQFYIGRRYYKAAYSGVKNKVMGMDFLVVFSTTLTYFYSLYLLIMYHGEQQLYFESSGLIITIVLIGKTIEDRVNRQTNDLVDKLNDLVSDEVKLESGEIKDVNFVEIGSVYELNPQEKIPLDGIVISGSATIDESMLTGESKLITKQINEAVYAGCINSGTKIKIKTTKLKDDNYINQIINSVEDAALIDTKYQKMADKISSIFVPVILLISLVTYFVTYAFTNDVAISFQHALVVIVISCPCSLGLATPTSIMASNSISAKLGILYKGSKFFELAQNLNILAFDKTGTLTHGKMEIVDFVLDEKYHESLYVSELQSNHPISKAVVKYLDIKNPTLKPTVELIPGVGLSAIIGKDTFIVGNKSVLNDQKMLRLMDELESDAKTVSVILLNGEYIGHYALKDEIKSESYEVIASLQKNNITPVLISGDNEAVVYDVAQKLGITDYYFKSHPEDKMEILKKYKTDENIIGFVGDGINDSVSLKFADVGIAVSTSSDIAKSASDVTLLHDDLNLVIKAIELSKYTKKNITTNFIWAFSYNIIAIPLAMFGYVNMIWAAVFMGFSSIVVVLNALHFKNKYMNYFFKKDKS